LGEFVFHKTLPPPGATAFGKIYERVDRPDLSIEHWQHLHGCRGWLLVRRNPTTGTVLETLLLGDGAAGDGHDGAGSGPQAATAP
jgi:sarcosine oxidase delta subunit